MYSSRIVLSLYCVWSVLYVYCIVVLVLGLNGLCVMLVFILSLVDAYGIGVVLCVYVHV